MLNTIWSDSPCTSCEECYTFVEISTDVYMCTSCGVANLENGDKE